MIYDKETARKEALDMIFNESMRCDIGEDWMRNVIAAALLEAQAEALESLDRVAVADGEYAAYQMTRLRATAKELRE